MDFAWPDAFRAVVRGGAFTHAAAEPHRSQPGMTRQIQRLERELGARLLERGGGIRLIPIRERVLAQAEIAHAARDAVRRAAGEVAVAGPLRIAASTSPVEPRVLVADTAVVENAVRAGQWDIGFVGARLAPLELRSLAVFEDEVVLAAPGSHPLADRDDVPTAALSEVSFIDREGGSGAAESVRQSLAAHGLSVQDHRPVMTLGSTVAVVAAVERGLGAQPSSPAQPAS